MNDRQYIHQIECSRRVLDIANDYNNERPPDICVTNSSASLTHAFVGTCSPMMSCSENGLWLPGPAPYQISLLRWWPGTNAVRRIASCAST